MKKYVVFGILLFGLLIIMGCLTQNQVNEKYLSDPHYCESDSDCIYWAQDTGIPNDCVNKYYQGEKIKTNPEDPCEWLCLCMEKNQCGCLTRSCV